MKKNKLEAALARNNPSSHNDLDARLSAAQSISSSMPNPLSQQRNTSTIVEQPTFTRESAPLSIVNVAIDKGNKTPYFVRVNHDLIDANPYNARVNYNPQRIHKMGSEIKADGQMVPGMATIRNGRYILAAGHYRWKGIGVANIGFMDLMIHEGLSDKELYKLSYKENAERSEQTPLDNALSWKRLLTDGIYENESALAEETGISLPNINKTINILKLPESVINYIQEQENYSFGLSPLYELVQYSALAGERKTLEMAAKMVNEEFGRSQIAAARALIQEPKKARKTKENSRHYKILDNAGLNQIGHIKDFGSGKILIELNIADDALRNSTLETLKAQFVLK